MFTPRFQAETEPDPADIYAAAVYGSILAAAFTTVFRQEHAAPQAVAISVLGTMAVFWIAHVWSAVLGERIHGAGASGFIAPLRSLAQNGRSSKPHWHPASSSSSAGSA